MGNWSSFSVGVEANSGKSCGSLLASCIVQLSVHDFFVVAYPLNNAVYLLNMSH